MERTREGVSQYSQVKSVDLLPLCGSNVPFSSDLGVTNTLPAGHAGAVFLVGCYITQECNCRLNTGGTMGVYSYPKRPNPTETAFGGL
jgi:hypothetical protein